MRALGFCVGSTTLGSWPSSSTQAGLRGGRSRRQTQMPRRDSRPSSDSGAANSRPIFTVDIFNEGVDIPEVDTMLLLRPTESATVFLQQLGRGLRWARGKSVLTVLDFIGQAHADYRFDIRFRAMIGGTRRQVERAAVEHGFPLMPPGCAIRLDEIAQEIVLENLQLAIRSTRRGLMDDLRGLPRNHDLERVPRAQLVRPPRLYLEPGLWFDVHRGFGAPFGTFAPAPPQERPSSTGARADAPRRRRRALRAWRSWLSAADRPLGAAWTREERLQWMLFAALGSESGRWPSFRRRVRGASGRRSSFDSNSLDLLDVLRERIA